MNKINIFFFVLILFLIFFLITILNKEYKILNTKKNLFLSTNDYPHLKLLEENADIFEKEIPKFDINKVTFDRNREDWNNEGMDKLFEKLKNNNYWIKSWDENNIWFNFPLIYNNKPVGLAEKICPKTIKILKQIPIIRVCGYSLLIPKSKLNIHKDLTGPNYNSMALNLHLFGKDSSLFIESDNIYYEKKHKKHKAIIFNSEKYHYAINNDKDNRIILYIDFSTDIFYGKVVKGLGIASKLEFPTFNIEFINKIKCGIYECDIIDTKYNGILFVDNNNYGELHILKDKNPKINNLIKINNLKKIENISSKGIINNYLKNCSTDN